MKSLFVIFLTCLGFSTIILNAQTPILIKDLNPGIASGIDLWYYKGIFFQGKYFMPGNDGVHGLELFVLENDMITLFKDIQIGDKGSAPQNFFIYNDKLYFTANDTLNGHEVWCTDGSPSGTQRITSIAPGTIYSNPKGFIIGGDNKFYFSNLDSLYKSDGTTRGTSVVKGIPNIELGENPEASPNATPFLDGLAVIVNDFREKSVWLINGKAEVKRIFLTQKDTEYNLLGLVNINSGLLFGLSNSLNTKNIGLYFYYVSDDTVRNIAATVNPDRIEKLDENYAIIYTSTNEYFVSNGTKNQTVEILKNAQSSLLRYQPLNFVKCGSNWLFHSHDYFGDRIVSITDGTIAGTKVAFTHNHFLSTFLQEDDFVFYFTGYTNNYIAELSYYDCKKGITKLIYTATDRSVIAPTYTPLFVKNGKYYFVGDIGLGRELYAINTGVVISNINQDFKSSIEVKQLSDRIYKIVGEVKDYSICLYNTNGQIVLQKKVKAEETFELGSEFFGLYILNISHDGLQSNIKLGLF
ncbi:MAG: hypothetical protein WAS56_02945 [Saprospiraceae bacterium]